MTIDCPLTCYVCGETREDAMTVDMIGCLEDQKSSAERFQEKFDKQPDGYLDICSDCRDDNPAYVKNVEEKYGVYGKEVGE